MTVLPLLLLSHRLGWKQTSIYSAKPQETKSIPEKESGRMMSDDEVSHVSQSLSLCSFTEKNSPSVERTRFACCLINIQAVTSVTRQDD